MPPAAPMTSPPGTAAWLGNWAVTVDVAGARMGGAARLNTELKRYLLRSARADVRIIGSEHQVSPAWLLRRELMRPRHGRFVALNNVSFLTSGKERWTLIRNALHFLTQDEMQSLDPAVRASAQREARAVRASALRADVLVAPCTAMAERICHVLPVVARRTVVRPHPVSADSIPDLPRDAAILCPILFSPYKRMESRLRELVAVLEAHAPVTLRVTADPGEVPPDLREHSAVEFVGRLTGARLRELWGRSRAIYFPTTLESFGYPLAEARASGHPVIACETPQNREIAGHALCGFLPGDADSLQAAVERALTTRIAADPEPFDPDSYFAWLLGESK